MSMERKHAGNAGGAVSTVARELVSGAKNAGPNGPGAFAQRIDCQRFSRLCVLMNPCPAGLEIHPDLAG